METHVQVGEHAVCRCTVDAMTKLPSARLSDLDLALHMATDVAPLAMRWFESVDLSVITKVDGSPVTQADLAVEKRLRELIRDHDSDASVLGEEEGATVGSSDRRWILDPIDGTSAFAHGVPLWSTLIALYDEHGPAVGVISLPGTGEIVAAGRGLGVTHNAKPCKVSAVTSLENAYVTTWGYEQWPSEVFVKLQHAKVNMRGWSDAYGWALLATGRVDAVLDPSTKLWDIAPMQTIIPEAGGMCTALPDGADMSFDWMIGTNGSIHDELMNCAFTS
jgi:histidinol-phosphatase